MVACYEDVHHNGWVSPSNFSCLQHGETMRVIYRMRGE